MKFRRYAGLCLAITFLDQGLKVLVKLTMYPGESWPLIGDAFRLTLVENNGFAFGLTLADLADKFGQSWSSETAKVILSLISLIALAALIYGLWRFSRHQSPLPYFLACVVGGALGNVIDRTFYGWIFQSINVYDGRLLHGRVVDMFHLNSEASWLNAPIFNLADVAIFVGVLTLLLFQGKFQRMHRKRVAAALSDDLSQKAD